MEGKGVRGDGKDLKKGRGGTGNGGQEERGKCVSRWTGRGRGKGCSRREENHGGTGAEKKGPMNKTSWKTDEKKGTLLMSY